MGSQITVDPGLLAKHATAIEAVAGRVGEAATAAQSSTGWNVQEAFGLLCFPMGLAANLVCGTTMATIAAASATLSATAVGVRESAAEFMEFEDNVRDELAKIGETLFGQV